MSSCVYKGLSCIMVDSEYHKVYLCSQESLFDLGTSEVMHTCCLELPLKKIKYLNKDLKLRKKNKCSPSRTI